ncbi:MAG: hypothetical protein COA69_01570 [Robiginitomaculum sp.]|nr:MAG: hypothetical protein COA69_01570 [Robiginitomaculum sp.]
MSNLILTGAKSLGQTLVHAAGRVAIAYANQAITNAFDNRVFEGPRLETLHIQSSRDGAPMARVYGRARIAGQVIWAAKLHEHVSETQQGGKGGGAISRDYNYTLSFAIGLCEGEILGVGQIWANGQPLQFSGLNTRLYLGGEDQMPDPLIVEIEGVDAPAFCGTAYMVFEDMPVDDFSARLPQLNFEIIRLPKRTNDLLRLEELVVGVDLIPGSGEFAYGTSITEERLGPGTSRAVNMNNLTGHADMEAALDQLQAQLPNCASVTLVVSWFGDDLRAGHCQLRAGVEVNERTLMPTDWRVGGENRASAYLISKIEGRPTYGGTPSDQTIIEAIQGLKARGFKVSFYPFILMDIPADNVLPDPYGGAAQSVFPWRGRITCDPAPMQPASVDGTLQAEQQIQSFFGTCLPTDFSASGQTVLYDGPNEHSLRRMVLHYAHLVQLAGGVDGFIISSEMRGLTTVRGVGNSYPSVTALQALSADVRVVVGGATRLTYAADWSEYFGHHPNDGSNDVYYHLDPLWADANIDAIGIDAYFPLSDWRDGDVHLDAQISPNIYDPAYLRANMEGGEGYEWYYASPVDRDAQTRSPITDGLAGKPWVFRYKDIRSWWSELHYERVGGTELGAPTDWVPKSKPVWFTEIGCPAIDKGANQPNVFWDPKSSESYAPYFSSGTRDDLIQRRYLEAFLGYWSEAGQNPVSPIYDEPMIDLAATHVWCWDARPFPDFPVRKEVWSDGDNWRTGHWISGRTGLVSLADITSDITVSSGGSEPDVSRLLGMVSGYVLDRPMSARAALGPLVLAYGFDLIEGAEGLRFASKDVQASIVLNLDNCVQGSGDALLTLHREDAGTRPKDVRLGFIEQGRDYQAASVTAQGFLAETERVLDVQTPLVLDPAQAKIIAAGLLDQALLETGTLEITVPPAWLSLEPGDVLQIEGEADRWQITDMDGLGQKAVRARRIGNNAAVQSSGAEPGAIVAAGWNSVPDGFALDIPDFTGTGTRQGPLVGVIVEPWTETYIGVSGSVVVTPESPVAIGYLMQDFPVGPVGRYDNGFEIDIYLPAVPLSSLDDEDLLAGGNLLAVESLQGWEIFQCQNAELISENTYRISRFLRGLFGSGVVLGASVLSGARIVWLGAGWQDLFLDTALRGADVDLSLTSVGRVEAETIALAYGAVHLRPLSPVHVKAENDETNVCISWIRRTRIGGDDWASLEVPLGEEFEQYEIDFMEGATVLTTQTVSAQSLKISLSELENLYGSLPVSFDIRIAQISRTFGRGAMCIQTIFL